MGGTEKLKPFVWTDEYHHARWTWSSKPKGEEDLAGPPFLQTTCLPTEGSFYNDPRQVEDTMSSTKNKCVPFLIFSDHAVQCTNNIFSLSKLHSPQTIQPMPLCHILRPPNATLILRPASTKHVNGNRWSLVQVSHRIHVWYIYLHLP